MPLDPAFVPLLRIPGIELEPPRRMSDAARLRARLVVQPASRPLRIASVANLSIGERRARVGVRLYRPSRQDALPAIVFAHGGGFVLCNLDTHDAFCRALAHHSRCAVLSVDYRKAPETPFPGAVEDCWRAVRWVARCGPDHGLDARRVAVAGDSGGGTLAAALAVRARDRGDATILHQALMYPALDPACASRSQREFGSGYLLSRRMMRWYWRAYLRDATDASHELATPAAARSLAMLAPATIVTAECDPLRDEGEAYAARLARDGVRVTARRYLGMIHGFMGMPEVTDVARRALADVAGDLKSALHGHVTTA